MAKLGIMGRILCGLFFLCLSFAGVSSMIGYIELTARTIQDFGGKHSTYCGKQSCILAESYKPQQGDTLVYDITVHQGIVCG